jgi:hypothetical protein
MHAVKQRFGLSKSRDRTGYLQDSDITETKPKWFLEGNLEQWNGLFRRRILSWSHVLYLDATKDMIWTSPIVKPR